MKTHWGNGGLFKHYKTDTFSYSSRSHRSTEAIMINRITDGITNLGYKNSASRHVSTLVLLIIITANLRLHPVRGSNIICSKSEYVMSGIEFKKCQDETLQSFEPQSEHARHSSKYIGY